MPAIRLPWTLSLIAAGAALVMLVLLWAGAPWQVPALLTTLTATLIGSVLD